MKSKLFILALTFSFIFGADKTRVAVLNLEGKSGITGELTAAMTELLSSELVAIGKFDVLDRKNLAVVLREQALQNSGCTESTCAVKLGNILNVQKMVVGTLSKAGGKFLITVSFIDVERSKIDISENISSEKEDDIANGIRRVAWRIGAQTRLSGRVIKMRDEGDCLVNIGQIEKVAVGREINFLRLGEAVTDPSTGELLGRDVKNLGVGRILSFMGDNLSYVDLSKLKEKLQIGDRAELIPTKEEISALSRGLAVSDKKPVNWKAIVSATTGAAGIGFGIYTLTAYSSAQSSYNQYQTAYSNLSNPKYVYDSLWNNYVGALTNGTYPFLGATVGCLVVSGVFLVLALPPKPKLSKTSFQVLPVLGREYSGLSVLCQF